MKNYIKLLFVLFAIPLVLSSCKDDENPGDALVGTWEQVSFVSSGCIDPDDNGSFTCTSSCERMVITNNTVTFGTDPAENYSVSGNQISIVETSGSTTVTTTGIFAITGTTLTITFQDSPGEGGCTNIVTFKKV